MKFNLHTRLTKFSFLFLILLVFISFKSSAIPHFLGHCQVKFELKKALLGIKGKNQFCPIYQLIISENKTMVMFSLSENAVWKLPNKNFALAGRYLANINGSGIQRLYIADQPEVIGMSFLPDGHYIDVSYTCHVSVRYCTSERNIIYDLAQNQICSYSGTLLMSFGKTNCDKTGINSIWEYVYEIKVTRNRQVKERRCLRWSDECNDSELNTNTQNIDPVQPAVTKPSQVPNPYHLPSLDIHPSPYP